MVCVFEKYVPYVCVCVYKYMYVSAASIVFCDPSLCVCTLIQFIHVEEVGTCQYLAVYASTELCHNKAYRYLCIYIYVCTCMYSMTCMYMRTCTYVYTCMYVIVVCGL